MKPKEKIATLWFILFLITFIPFSMGDFVGEQYIKMTFLSAFLATGYLVLFYLVSRIFF